MSLKNLNRPGAWGNLIWEESEGPKIIKLMSEQKELEARIESLEDRLYGAMHQEPFLSERHRSPHLNSSGQSGNMTRKKRQEHYRRKGSLEAKKEARRREIHDRLSPESFRELEENRKAYKAQVRAIRKSVKAGRRKGA
jgi:hypothetical protein